MSGFLRLCCLSTFLVFSGQSLANSQTSDKTPSSTENEHPLQGKQWAVVVGIDHYEKALGLNYAVSDAKAVEDFLKAQGFEVESLFNERATRSAILEGMGDKLIHSVGPEDRVLIFFA